MTDELASLLPREMSESGFFTLCENLKAARHTANWTIFLIVGYILEEMFRFNTNKINGLLLVFVLGILFCCKGLGTATLLKSIKGENLSHLKRKIKNMLIITWACAVIALLITLITLLESDLRTIYAWVCIFLLQIITLSGYVSTTFKLSKLSEDVQAAWGARKAAGADEKQVADLA